jgi:hypothetical protein
VGAVLSQEGKHTSPSPPKCAKPVLNPIAYYSATFTPVERNYNIYKRELLAIMKPLAHWQPYLGWIKEPFTIPTDHANLQYWKSPKNTWHNGMQTFKNTTMRSTISPETSTYLQMPYHNHLEKTKGRMTIRASQSSHHKSSWSTC